MIWWLFAGDCVKFWNNRAKRADLSTLAVLSATLNITPGDLLVLESFELAGERR